MITNQSREKVWETCPRSYFHRYVCNLDAGSGVKAFLGTVGHAALADWYRGLAACYLDTFKRGIAAAPPEIRTGEDFDKFAAIWAERLHAYPTHWAGEDRQFEIVLVPEAEVPLRLDDQHVMLTRADLIVRRRDNGSLWVMDHKFASRTGPSWWAQFAVDKQGSAYTLAAEQLTGEPVAGWIINAIKPTKDSQFERQAFARSRAQLESFKRQTIYALDVRAPLMRNLAELPVEDRPRLDPITVDLEFPQHTGACHNFGNCPFIGLCAVGPSAAVAFKRREPDYVDTFAG